MYEIRRPPGQNFFYSLSPSCLAFQNPEFNILAKFNILAFQNPQFKILAFAFQNPEFKILDDVKILASKILNSRFWPI